MLARGLNGGVNKGRMGLTNRDDVGNDATDRAEVERRANEVLAAAEEGDADGHNVAQVQEDDTNTVEGVESGVGAEVDEGEEDLEDEAANHAVERDAHAEVDLLEPAGSGQGTVTGKGPNTARGCGGASNAAEDSKDHERAGEDESAGFAADC